MKGVINVLNKKQKQTIELITKMLQESGEQYTICANQSQIEKTQPRYFYMRNKRNIIEVKWFV